MEYVLIALFKVLSGHFKLNKFLLIIEFCMLITF